MSLAVIIPSRSRSNLDACAVAVREHEPGARIVVAWDRSRENAPLPPSFLYDTVEVEAPFVFAQNVNIGIAEAIRGHRIDVATHSDPEPRYAGYGIPDGLVLLNDDALLKTPGGFSAMQRAAEEHPEFGVISAVTNVAGNPDQFRKGVGLRDAGSKCVAFVCVLIPRRTIERVGLLDERFTAYGWEDNDYCRRVREAGLKVGIFDGCFVDHASLKSTFRGDPRAAGDIYAGMEIYRQKWGDLA